MKILLAVFVLIQCLLLRASAEQITASGTLVNLPAGEVIGVGISAETSTFYVQQAHFIDDAESVSSASRWHREISSWQLDSHLLKAKRILDDIDMQSKGYPCGRVGVAYKLQRILVCSANKYLEVLDSVSLKTVGRIVPTTGEVVLDFAIDEQRDRVAVLSTDKNSSIQLAFYSVLDGVLQQKTSISSLNKFDGVAIALEPASGQVAFAIKHDNKQYREVADIYFCRMDSSIICTDAGAVDPPASQMSFLGKRLLYSTSFGNEKSECIMGMDSNTHSVSREYCADTGVHYAFGIADNEKYIVGYTGLSKHHVLSESTTAATNTFSVWRADIPKAATAIRSPINFGSYQIGTVIVASKSSPYFIAYAHATSELCVFSITDSVPH